MKLFVATLFVFVGLCTSLADLPRLEGMQGNRFYPPTNTIITWIAASKLPEALCIYKSVPQSFSVEVISNAMSLCGFDWKHLSKKTAPSIPDKNLIQFSDKKVNWTRHLVVAPNLGWMEYNADADTNDFTNGVPTKEQVDKLALGVLFQFGIKDSMLTNKQEHETVQGMLSRQGERLTTNVVNRGVSYTRLVNGVEFGNSTCFTIDFGSHAQITHFRLDWKNILPCETHLTLSTNEILELVKSGNSLAAPWENLDALNTAKTISVVNIKPKYFEGSWKQSLDFMYPFVTLEMVAKFEGTNSTKFYIQCPVLSTNLFPMKTL